MRQLRIEPTKAVWTIFVAYGIQTKQNDKALAKYFTQHFISFFVYSLFQYSALDHLATTAHLKAFSYFDHLADGF